MSRATRALRRPMWMVFPVALALVMVWQADETPGVPPARAQGAGAPAAPAAPWLVLSHTFYGSTPSLAWSPDGQRLAFNAAYEYFGHETELAAYRASLGLWVYERGTGAARQLVAEQRYHPAWLGDGRIATGCSPYEDCAEGLYVTDLEGHDSRVLEGDGVYHTAAAAASADQVVFYNGWSGYTRWNRFDTPSERRETGLSANCSWEPPPELVVDQCVQTVGDVTVAADAASGLWVRYGEGTPIQVDRLLPFQYSSSAWDCRDNHSGPVAPCLSADARQVAYVAEGPGGTLLRVHALPTAAELAAAPPPAAAVPAPAEALFLPTTPGPEATVVTTPEPQPLLARTTPAVGSDPARAYLGFDFYGDTVSLAWSPDGRHLAFNAAYQSSSYRGEWDTTYSAVSDELGLFVADVAASAVRRVAAEERYHPAWHNDEALVSACTSMEACTDGLGITGLDGSTTIHMPTGVANTAVSADGRVLVYDWVVSSWALYDPASGGYETGVSTDCMWEPPPQIAVDQCVQEVGDVRVWVQAGTGLYAQVAGAEPVRLDPNPPWLYEGYAWGCRVEDHSGPVEPCLSPDGSRVAYVSRSLTGLSLHLHEIPR